ncbi:SipW-dependent-type signal peptide-containing protein [Virgibacillus sp. NKC19-16]|uniref:TasA family protein n=1 Tax=Virgibacillus salidurans TaxID=2831673 RepID=UPI001F1CB0D1|nr:TasA family protein [Virgibacillus sp. NKC19-16]UJL45656.1 SipW-dependent-type signal peptide-containing protein [Virgibacillus sp. NKC19-16]
MTIKKKLAMSIVLAAVGLSLIVGGTSAYFTDTTSTDNRITTGSLDLGMDKETIFQIEDLVPGDTQDARFELTNDGSVDMKEIILNASYEVVDKGEPNSGDDLGNHILVELLSDQDGEETLVFEKTLAELNSNPQQIVESFPEEDTAKNFIVQFTFTDSGENQNHFQTDQLELNWEFEAVQRDGNEENIG